MTGAVTLGALARNKKVLFAGAGAVGGFASGTLTKVLGLSGTMLSSWVLAGGLDAALIGMALVHAQNYYQTKSLAMSDGLKQAAKAGFLVGCLGGVLALVGLVLFAAGDFGRIVGWAISGSVAGYVVSRQVRNLGRKPAMLAGACGGAIGCLVMYMNLGYATGVAVTGAAIGLMVAMAEAIFRKNWLDVEVYAQPLGTGLNLAKPTRQFTLSVGAEPITIGTREGLDIRLNPTPGTAPDHAASIYCDGDRTIFHDLQNGTRTELRGGEPFRFRECQLRLGS